MRQKTILTAFIVLSVLCVKTAKTQSIPQAIGDSIAKDRTLKLQTNMKVLAAWAGVNIIQGNISATNAIGSDKHFFRTNAYWNIINLGIAGYGLWYAGQSAKKNYAGPENMLEQQKIEKILLKHAALNTVLVGTGLIMKERGARLNKEKSTGIGNSLLVQGSFSVIFDLIQYLNHRKNGQILRKEQGNWQLTSSLNGIGLSYTIK